MKRMRGFAALALVTCLCGFACAPKRAAAPSASRRGRPGEASVPSHPEVPDERLVSVLQVWDAAQLPRLRNFRQAVAESAGGRGGGRKNRRRTAEDGKHAAPNGRRRTSRTPGRRSARPSRPTSASGSTRAFARTCRSAKTQRKGRSVLNNETGPRRRLPLSPAAVITLQAAPG